VIDDPYVDGINAYAEHLGRRRILDLFCGAGGCSMGYSRAGFDVIGVDIAPQPHYPFRFAQADALKALQALLTGEFVHFGDHGLVRMDSFDAIHASPPCQAYSRAQKLRGREHPDLVGPTRELLLATGLPYVIENVPGAPLIDPVVLEGQMFEGLRTQRKRCFETNWPLEVPTMRSPRPAPNTKMGRRPKPGEWVHVVGNCNGIAICREAMNISWMNRDELSQAIPPPYTELVGKALLAHLAQVSA
jgi:DNA (cytosine-5)-methyltransferase 1